MSYDISDNRFILRFTQMEVDWINQNYSQRLWFLMDGSIRVKPTLYADYLESDLDTYKITQYAMPTFGFTADIFWDFTKETREKLIRAYCEYMIENYQGMLFINSLKGVLTRIVDNGYVAKILDSNGTITREVGVVWTTRGYFE